MWTCPRCARNFIKDNQHHYCGDATVQAFLAGRSVQALEIFDALVHQLAQLGPVSLHATKSMIVMSADLRFAYIIQIGRSHVDVVLPFSTPHADNLCFRKIARVPGTSDFNHHLRLLSANDLNDEVLGYLQKAYQNGKTR